LVRAPGLEPESGGEEAFSSLRELSLQCLEDIRKGRTAIARQLLSMLAGGMMETSKGLYTIHDFYYQWHRQNKSEGCYFASLPLC